MTLGDRGGELREPTEAAVFERLDRIVARLGLGAGARDPGFWRHVPASPRAPTLEVAAIEPAVGRWRVTIDGWAWEPRLDAEPADDAERAALTHEAARAAIDLAAACLVGWVQVERLEGPRGVLGRRIWLEHPTGRRLVGRAGRAWAIRGRWVVVGHSRRDPGCLRIRRAKVAPPWAPWTGAAGELGWCPPAAGPAADPLDGTLDLHPVPVEEVVEVVDAYLDACQRAGVLELRLVHGKGKGTVRTLVHALLARHPAVAGFGLAPPTRGGWGATVVHLRAPGPGSGGAPERRGP